MRNLASLVGKVVLIVTSLTAAAAATAGAAAATPVFVDRSAKLRSGPGPGYHMLATLPRGTAVDVRGCRSGWCEIAWAGGRGYVAHNLLAPAGMMPAATIAPGVEGEDYPGFDYPGTAYAPTFSVATTPRWLSRRWTRWQQRPAWRALPPQISGALPRSPDRTIIRGGALPPPFGPVGGFGETRPTVGNASSDGPLPTAARSAIPAPPVPPLPIPSAPPPDRR